MSQCQDDHKAYVVEIIDANDYAFNQDDPEGMKPYFTENICLQWPFIADIVGRKAVHQAFKDFVSSFTTISYKATYDVVDVVPPIAHVHGTFKEVCRLNIGGPAVKVFGRIEFILRLEEYKVWRITRIMTSRIGEDEILPNVQIPH